MPRQRSLLGSYTARRPERNPGVDPASVISEPYILGNLAGLDMDFRRVLSLPTLWQVAACLLETTEEATLYHSSQIVRKPALIGAALSWHRDYANTYISTTGPHFVRLSLPLEVMSRANGGTGVVAGSHLISDEEASDREGCQEDGADAAYPRVTAGDVLAIHCKLIHGGGTNRSRNDRQLLAV